jgi:hypothetical protein
VSDKNLERRLAYWRKTSEQYAVAEANRVRLDHWRKVVLAEQMIQAEREGATSVSAQEREARASQPYRDAIEALSAATEEALRLGDEVRMARLWSEAWRTEQANERGEKKAYGAQQ